MGVKDLGSANYATHVANKTTSQVTALRKRAKAMALRTAAQKNQSLTRYGTALGGVTNQAYKTAEAEAAAARAMAAARAKQAGAQATAAATSASLYRQEQGQMGLGQTAALQRVRQEAQPGLISARSAIESANAYAKRIGIDLKSQSWEAKAAFYTHVLDTQNSMMMAQFQSDLELEQQKRLFRLNQRQTDEAALAGAPSVVSTVNASMPSMLTSVKATLNDEVAMKNVAQTASQWAATQTVDENAAKILADLYIKTVQQAPMHTAADGALDGGWMRGLVVSTINTAYPGYTGDTDIENALSDGVIVGSYNAASSGGGLNFSLMGAVQTAAEELNPVYGAFHYTVEAAKLLPGIS